MLAINLLPREEKQVIIYEEWRRLIRFFGISMCGALGIGMVGILPSYFPLALRIQELRRSLALEERALEDLKIKEAEISLRVARHRVEEIQKILDASGGASNFLKPFLDTMTMVSINAISGGRKGTFSMSGRAPTRRALLQFEDALRAAGKFQDIYFPLSNIVQEVDINFTVQGTLKEQYRW